MDKLKKAYYFVKATLQGWWRQVTLWWALLVTWFRLKTGL